MILKIKRNIVSLNVNTVKVIERIVQKKQVCFTYLLICGQNKIAFKLKINMNGIVFYLCFIYEREA